MDPFSRDLERIRRLLGGNGRARWEHLREQRLQVTQAAHDAVNRYGDLGWPESTPGAVWLASHVLFIQGLEAGETTTRREIIDTVGTGGPEVFEADPNRINRLIDSAIESGYLRVV